MVKKPFGKPLNSPFFQKHNNPLSIKWLSPKEMMEWWEKILCYNYDEKYGLNHRCTIQKFYSLNIDALHELVKKAYEDVFIDIKYKTNTSIEDSTKISCNILSIFSSMKTMKYHRYFK